MSCTRMFGIHCVKRGGQIPAFSVPELTESDGNTRTGPVKTARKHNIHLVEYDEVMAK